MTEKLFQITRRIKQPYYRGFRRGNSSNGEKQMNFIVDEYDGEILTNEDAKK